MAVTLFFSLWPGFRRLIQIFAGGHNTEFSWFLTQLKVLVKYKAFNSASTKSMGTRVLPIIALVHDQPIDYLTQGNLVQ